HDPQRGLRRRLPARRRRRRPAYRVDARRLRPRPGLPGADGRRGADLQRLGARPVPHVGSAAARGGQPADAVPGRVRVDLPERPRFVVGLPRDFFAAVRAELGERRPSPQTRDMNPVYTGKDVSYIDTKQAQRAAEVAVLDAERLATLAALRGARYPAEALDKA